MIHDDSSGTYKIFGTWVHGLLSSHTLQLPSFFVAVLLAVRYLAATIAAAHPNHRRSIASRASRRLSSAQQQQQKE